MNMHDTVKNNSDFLSGQTSAEKRPVRMARWFIIVGLLLGLVLVAVVGFNIWLTGFLKNLFANMAANPPPVVVSISVAKTEVLPKQMKAVGELAAVHQVDVTTDVSGRVMEILFEPGSQVKKGDPLVQLYDAPERSDLASLKAQLGQARLVLERAKELMSRQAGTQASVDQAQAAFDQAAAGVAKTEALISQKLVKAPFDGVLGVRRVNVGQFLSPGTQIVSLTDVSSIFSNFTVTEKDSSILRTGQAVRVSVDAYPDKVFDGKITTIEPQINTDTRSIRVQATLSNPEKILKSGMFAETTVVLPPDPPVITLPETAVDYTLYGDSVYRIAEKKADDGTARLTAERIFVRTGEKAKGRVAILSGVREGDKVVAVGQNKLQPGAVVTISDDPPPQPPAAPARN